MFNPDPKPTTKRLHGKKRTLLRRECAKYYNYQCVDCGRYIPLYDSEGCFDMYTCGHMSHERGVGAGGEDNLENTRWRCCECHRKKDNRLYWSFPA